MLVGRSAVLTCSVESLAAKAITPPFLRREMFLMGGYPPVAEQTSMVFSFVPFNCRVNKGYILCKKKYSAFIVLYCSICMIVTQR